MTATVVNLASRRRPSEPTCGCPRHALEALIDRAAAQLAADGGLLLPRDALESVVNDMRATTAHLLSATSERTNP